MTGRYSTALFCVLTPLALIACGDPTAVSPNADEDALQARAARGGWAQNVSGGGRDLYPGSISPDFSISFTAKTDMMGKSSGIVTWNNASGALISQGRIQCLTVIGKRAYMRYQVTQGDPTDWTGGYGTVGNQVILGFEDNGEGAGAPPDRHTYIYYAGPDFTAACTNIADFLNVNGGGFPVVWKHGNVQIR